MTPKVVRRFVKRVIFFLKWDEWVQCSWSQEGEDIILKRIFDNVPVGYYVDIGAHHPMRLSNTYHFYKRGWKGINVDAMPGSMDLFKKYRPNDINLELGVGCSDKELDYYIFNEKALNSFSTKIVNNYKGRSGPYFVEKVVKIKIEPLSKLFEKYLPPGQAIDFMTIDVEGFDEDVLLSNDWQLYRPKIVLVEILRADIDAVFDSAIHGIMINNNYKLLAKSANTCFYASNEF